jgi:probable O-glycosylation ligase (exosortase A-associated)
MKGLLFTYALTYGGALASLFNPFIGLLIYVAFSILRPESLWFWSVPAGNYSRIIAIALLVGWAMKGFGNWNFGRSKAVVWSLVGFMGWMALSAIFARSQDVAWGEVETKFKIVLPCLVGFTVIKSLEELKQLTWVIVFSMGYVAFEANMTYLTGFNQIREYGFAGMDNNCLAIAMDCGAGFAFFLGLAETVAWRRWLSFFAAGLMAHVVLFSNSRGGMLGLVLTGAAAFIMVRKQPVHYAYLLLALLVGLRLAGPAVWERFNTTFAEEDNRDSSAESRLYLWTACTNCMIESPLVGIGPHHFPLMADSLGFTKGKEAHSLWFQLGAECGIPCVGFLLAFYGITAVRLWKLARQLDQVAPEISDSCRMVIASLLGFFVSSQFVTLVGLELPYYVVLVGAGYLKLAEQHVLASQTDHSPAPPAPFVAPSLILPTQTT